MSVHVLADGTAGPIGVLVDDPACGKLLLDCGTGVTTAAAFAGLSLAGAQVVTTGVGTDHLDPSVPAAAVVTAHPCVHRLASGALLVTTSRGLLLHGVTTDELPSGTRATLPGTAPFETALPGVSTTRRVLVTGGSRSGKSAHAEALLVGRPAVTYLATGPAPAADDPEWAARVALHQERRPTGWTTVETPDAAAALTAGDGPVLLDSVGTWLAAAMDAAGTWDGRGDAELAAAVDTFVDTWARVDRDVVAVTEEVGSGVVPATAAGRRFRDELGRLNVRLAAAADEVWLVTAGIGSRLR